MDMIELVKYSRKGLGAFMIKKTLKALIIVLLLVILIGCDNHSNGETVYTIEYVLNDGAFSKYTDKETLANDFLNDFFDFVGPEENLNVFKHGDIDFGGLWYQKEEYRNKLFKSNYKGGTDNKYFAAAPLYKEKWLPFFEMINDFIHVGDKTESLWRNKELGSLRTYQYLTNTKPSSVWLQNDMEMLPTDAIVTKHYTESSPALFLPTPILDGYTFLGWYTKQVDGEKATRIPRGSRGDKTFYAFWERIFLTSTKSRYYNTKTDFENSPAYQEYEEYANKLIYNFSFAIPGLEKTYFDDLFSNNMTPQGLTIANDYFLISAYDSEKEMNSVIYALDKNGKLVIVIILPNKAHVGGLTFDGENIWVSGLGQTIHSFKYSLLLEAIHSKVESYNLASYEKDYEVSLTPSFLSYYNDMVWVGRFDVSDTEYMYGYVIRNKAALPSLIKELYMRIPNRTQGAAFTNDGKIILSRSYSRQPKSTNYISQLEFYNPSWEEVSVNGLVNKGEVLNILALPPMAEGIVIDNGYLYVNFESAATVYNDCPYITDRVIAFKFSDFYN